MPIVWIGTVLRVNGWISKNLKNEVAVQFMTAVRAWRDEEPVCVELELYNVASLAEERGTAVQS